jgi:hypothetical protein
MPTQSWLGRVGHRVAAAGVAIGSAAALASCGGGTSVDWAIVQSGPGGDTLIVAPLTALRPCDGVPKADLRKSNANRVEIAVTVEQGSCGDEGARPANNLAVKLAQPLRGQQITGPGLRPPSANPAAKTSGTMPSIVGFRLPDARAILAARSLEIDRIVGPTGAATEVTSQSPPAGATGASTSGGTYRPTVSVRTVPR